MNRFNKKGKSALILMLVLAIIFQLVGPMVLDYSYANEKTVSDDVYGEPIEMMNSLGSDDEQTVIGEVYDHGNIFTLSSFKVNGKEADENMVVEIKDGTTVTLDYTWDTIGLNVKSGDYAEINIPNAFKLNRDFEDEDIVISGGAIVGKYSIINNKLRFEFDDGIETVGQVENGILGFGVNFNEEEFTEDVVEEIEFKDKGNKTITIIGKPTNTVSEINKKGIPDSSKDAKEITWTVDIVNSSNTEITGAKLTDVLPTGLEIDADSILVKNLNIKLDGSLNEGSTVSKTPTINGRNFEMDFDIAPYKGYRVEYTTKITDYSIDKFTNDANLVDGDKELPAKATVSIERSDLIEKDGKKIADQDTIEWWIDVNKAGASIDEAIVEDTLSAGTVLVQGSIKIFKLTKGSGDNWNESQSDKTATVFPVNLGSVGTNDAYRIKFETEIDYSQINSGDYKKDNNFTNETILKNGTQEIGDAEKTVKITRKPILEKTGKSQVDYNNKILKWTVTVNEANHEIADAVITDILPAGLTINKSDIKVKDSNGDEVTENITITVPSNDGLTTTEIKIDLGNITEKYTIEYTTTITDFTINTFKNGVSLGGTGVGTGGTIDPVPINPPNNSYGKSFSSIDYNEKTMNWTITANPTREAIETLKITDTFPNKGLILLPDTLEVKVGGTKLAKDTDYTLVFNGSGYKDGFIVEFLNNALPINADVEITYTTSYNPEAGIDENTSIDDIYINQAKFEGKTENNNSIDVTKDAKKKVNTETINTGKKLGKLVSIDEEGKTVNGWTSGNTRRIHWEVYTNYLKQNLGTGVSVSDVLGYEGEVDMENIKVYKYAVGSNGKTTLADELNNSNYTVTPAENNKGFTLNFKEDFVVDERYAIVFTTSVPEISQKTYTNTATTKVGEEEYPYTGSVSFDKWDNNLSKEAIGISGDKVYTDDEVNWKIKINEALSVIEKDVRLVDTISNGMVFKEGSLKLYKFQGTERILVEDGYTLNKSTNVDGETILEILFDHSINETYEIEYNTVITAIDGKVNNSVEYSGKNETIDTVTTKELTAEQFSYVGGDPAKGKIKIIKQDENGVKITSSEATFALWYELNGEYQKFQNKNFETTDGEVEIGNLALNKTYYIEEITAPNEYVKSSERFEIKVETAYGNSNSNIVEQIVENKKIKGNIEFKKVDEDLSPLKGAEFGLYENDATGKPFRTIKSVDDGTVSFKEVPYGDYKIKEIEAPEGYLLSSEVLDVSIRENVLTVTPKDSKGKEISQIVNISQKGNIEINKVDEEGNALQGAKFKLYKQTIEGKIGDVVTINGEDLVSTSNSSGIVEFKNIPYGDYIIKEFVAPDGYMPSDREVKVSIVNDGETVKPIENDSIVNTKIIGDIQVIKLDEDGETGLPGAVFVLEQDGEIKYTSDKTNEFGIYVFKDIKYGKYTLKEKIPPTGYNPTDQVEEVEIKEKDQDLITKKFINTKIRGSIKVKKLGEDEEGLEGAEFSLYKADDTEFENPKYTATSDENGEVLFTEVEFGKYNIKETKAPQGYNLSEKVIKDVEVKEQGVEVIPTDNEISNTKIKGSLEITKVRRYTDYVLEGAKIALYRTEENKDDVLIEEKVTGKDGKVIFEDLVYGDYYFKETKSPIGYYRNSEENPIEIREDGVIVKVKFENKRIPSDPTDPWEPEDPKEPEKPTDPEEPEDPTDAEEPEEPTDPEDPEEPTDPEKPTEPDEPIETEPDTPVTIEPDVPEGGTVVVEDPPENGEVTFDEDGNPVYTPNKGFTGKDKFKIKIITPDGEEEIIEIEIDIPEAALITEEEEDKLAKTGEIDSKVFYISGLLLILVGFFIRRKTA